MHDDCWQPANAVLQSLGTRWSVSENAPLQNRFGERDCRRPGIELTRFTANLPVISGDRVGGNAMLDWKKIYARPLKNLGLGGDGRTEDLAARHFFIAIIGRR